MDFNSLNKLKQQEIIETLNQFGLGEKDRKVYFALMKMGKSTITPISRAIRFPATTVQSILSKLEKKGLLNVTMIKSRHIYETNDPTIFKKILERQMQDLNNIMPLLKNLNSAETAKSKIKIYYRDQMSEIFHQALLTSDKLVYEIISAKDFQDILGEKFHFTKRRLENNIHLKSLRVEKHEIKKYNQFIHQREDREAKFLPAELTFRCSVMFWDNTVAFFTTKEEGLAWTVESQTFSKTMKQIFDLLWSISRKMETLK